MTFENLTTKQYWLVILLAFGLLIINGFLVVKLLNHEVEFDISCPVPVDKIKECECKYDPFGARGLQYCICYPESKFDSQDDMLNMYKKINNGTE